MVKTYNRLEIDVNKKPNRIGIRPVQNDTKSRYLDVCLYENGVPIDLTGEQVRITFRKADGSTFFNQGEVTDATAGRCQFALTNEILSEAKAVEAQISVWNAGGQILSTQVFEIYVTAAIPWEDSVESENEYGVAAYVILGINTEGKKEVLTISVGDNESAKYWLSVMNELKNRGVKDVLIICADGLIGIKEAIAAAFPKTEYQRCIVHQVRNTLKYVPDKDRKAFAADLKTIYQAADEKKALAALEHVTEKWTPKYPNSMKRWKDNWDAISPIFKFSATVRKVIYTTNAIESLHSTYRKLNRQRSVFPSDTALLKALYLATFEATKKWTSTIRNWAQVHGELSIMYEGRLPE
nr:IS256 family transposase [uncultured Anaerotignum sp.]